MYPQEPGLNVETSAMSVPVQEMVIGERPGVAFTRDPTEGDKAVIASVCGLNQGLDDRTVEPHRDGRGVISRGPAPVMSALSAHEPRKLPP